MMIIWGYKLILKSFFSYFLDHLEAGCYKRKRPRKQTPLPLIQIDNNVIECVENFNFLGLIINKQWKWKDHIDHIVLKIPRIIGVLTRLKNHIPLNILITLYNSLLLPHINYLLIVWGHQPSKLTNLQKKCIRIISKNKRLPIQIHYLKTCIF